MERSRESQGFSPEINPDYKQPVEGEIRIMDGKEYRAVKLPWTIREYYSHDGPGWDFKVSLYKDKERSLKEYGRTFSIEEAFSPSTLPETPMFSWEPVDPEPIPGDGKYHPVEY